MPVIACCEAHDITTGTTQFVKTSDAYLERRAQQRRSASPARIMGRRDDHHQLEEGCELMLDWRKLHKVATCGDDVVPVAVQDADTREMLILAYANEHALAEARRRGVCVLWSTSRRKLWIKGETSGDVLDLVEIRVNCEQNSLLYLVKPRPSAAA